MTIGPDGNLYGTLASGPGYGGLGSIFKFTRSGNGWVFGIIHEFTGGSDGATPFGLVTFDSTGTMHGTTRSGGNNNCQGGCGVVWQLTP